MIYFLEEVVIAEGQVFFPGWVYVNAQVWDPVLPAIVWFIGWVVRHTPGRPLYPTKGVSTYRVIGDIAAQAPRAVPIPTARYRSIRVYDGIS